MSRIVKSLVVSGFFVGAILLASGLSAQTTANPSPSPSPSTMTCATGQELCKSSDGFSTWCSSSPCSESTCNAKTGYEWCKPDPSWPNGQGWCNSQKGSCPIYDSATCTSLGRKWCLPDPNIQTASATGSGATSIAVSKEWCTYSATEKCPAYTESDCTSQGGKWCKNAAPAAGTTTYYSPGWCAQNMGANYECPINDQATCNDKGRTWCKDSWSGWCMSSSNDWCSGTKVSPPTATTTPTPTTQPPYQKCPGGLVNMDGSCAQPPLPPTVTPTPEQCLPGMWKDTATLKCIPMPSPMPPSPSPMPTPTWSPPPPMPPMDWSWPNTQAECDYYRGKWCESNDTYYAAGYKSNMTSMSNGYCKMGNEECEPKDKKECDSRGRYWCEYNSEPSYYSSGSSGWCSYDPCYKNAKPGMMVCPDGVTDAKSIKDCPNKGDVAPIMQNEWDWSSKKEVCEYYRGNWCPSNWGSGYCNQGNRKCDPTTKQACQDMNRYWCEDDNAIAFSSAGYKTSPGGTNGWCSYSKCYKPAPFGMIKCPDGVTDKAKLKDCPTTGIVPPAPTPEKCPTNMVKDTATMKCIPLPSHSPWPTLPPKPSPTMPPYQKCSSGMLKMDGTCSDEKQKEELSEKDLKWRENEIKYITLDLVSLEKDFKTYSDEESLKIVAAIRLRLESLAKDQTMFGIIERMQEEVKQLRTKRTELKNKKKTETQKRTDERRRENLLKNIKTSSERYYKRVTETLEALETFENVGGTAPESLKQKLRDMKTSLETIKETTSYETARDLMRELNSLDILDIFDEYALEISVLPELPRIMRDMDTNLAEMEKQLEAARISLENEDFDAESLLSESESRLSEIRLSYELVKGLAFVQNEDNDIFDYRSFKGWVKEHLTMALVSISNDLRELKQLSRLKTFIKEANSDLTKYKGDARKLKGKSRTNANKLVATFERELKSLDRSVRRLKKDDLPDLLPQIEKVANARYAVQVFLKKKTAEVQFRQKLDDLIKKLDEEEKEEKTETANLPTLKSLVEETLKVE